MGLHQGTRIHLLGFRGYNGESHGQLRWKKKGKLELHRGYTSCSGTLSKKLLCFHVWVIVDSLEHAGNIDWTTDCTPLAP